MKKTNPEHEKKIEAAKYFISTRFDKAKLQVSNLFKKIDDESILKLEKFLKIIETNPRLEEDSLTSEQLERQDFVDNKIYQLLIELSGNKYVDWDIEYISFVRLAVQEVLCNMENLISEQDFYPYIEIPNEHKIICSLPKWVVKPILWLTSFSKDQKWIVTCIGYDEDFKDSTQLEWKEDKDTPLEDKIDFMLCKKRNES